MSGIAIAEAAPRPSLLNPGRAFLHPAFDYLVIAGGLSLPFVAWLRLSGSSLSQDSLDTLWILVLLSNSAHFAASTVRLYSKRGAFESLPFLTMGLPLATILVLLAALAFPRELGRHIQALYLTWSPYHYAAQAYGLAVMYCYRSGVSVGDGDKRWLRAACLMPFLYAFLNGRGCGIEWFVPESALSLPAVVTGRVVALGALAKLSFLVPLGAFVRLQGGPGPRMPVISLVVMIANGVWWIVLTYMDAFVWATVFHGLQYLAIVTIFQVREDLKAPGNVGPWWRHAARFYAFSLVLGYLLFQVWPHGFALLGFSFAESLLLVVAAVNIHHFIVDAFIWRLRKDPNYAVVTAASPSPA